MSCGKLRRSPDKPRRDASTPDSRDLLIRRASSLEQAHDLDKVFFAHLEANIAPRTPEHLADLAIESARSEAGLRREDGISYLLTIKENGISTPLLALYEREILRKTQSPCLRDARQAPVD